MKNVLILHGTANDSTRNWIPWLKTELGHRGFLVWTPNLPKAETPNIERYNEFILPQWSLNKESIIVGHSSGAVAILGLLQALPDACVIDKAILVAGFTDDLDYPPVKEMFRKPFFWEIIRSRAKKCILFHSDNDPYVSLWHGEKLRKLLGAELVVIKGQAHFSTTTYPDKEKYKKFPELLEKILE